MKILVILAHPNMGESKVNKAWIERLKEENDVKVHDLYECYSDGKIDIKKEQELVEDHDRIVFEFPLYWYSSPSLLKQWQDDVLQYGWAYGSKGNKLQGKEFMIATSTGGPKNTYRAGGENNITISELMKPFQSMANMTGMKFLPTFALYGTLGISDEKLSESAEDLVNHIKTESFTR